MTRTRLSSEQRRAQLLDLGVQLLTTRTLEELSVEDLAEQAGISRGLLFHYFRSKAEFHLAVAEQAAQELISRTEPDTSLPEDQRLRASLGQYVDYVTQNVPGYVALVRGAASGDEAMQAVFERTRARLAQRVLDTLPSLGLPADARAELAVRGWVAYAEECVIRSHTVTRLDRDELVGMIADALFALVATVPAAAAEK